MTGSREAIYAALFSLLGNCAPFAVTGRRLQAWEDTQEQPALFQMQSGEQAAEGAAGMPLRWKLSVRIWIYAKTDGSPSAVPSSALNPLIDAVDSVLGGSSLAIGRKQTLGGLVLNAWIDGEVRIFEGVLGQQAVAIIPVSILTT